MSEEAEDNEYDPKVSASIGGRVGSVTGEGISADVLRDLCENDGEVGDVWGERRLAKEDIGVQDAAAILSCCNSEPRRERRLIVCCIGDLIVPDDA